MWPAKIGQTRQFAGSRSLKVLGLDTACGACSAAVWTGETIAARRFEHRARGHAEALMPMVQAVMEEAALGYEALDAIAVTRGPGTFTGLRIGLAAARGLALAANLPLIGLTTLEVIAAEARTHGHKSPIVVAIDARRGHVYAQSFRADGTPVEDPRAIPPEAAVLLADDDQTVFAGDMAENLVALNGNRGVVAPGSGQPDAAILAQQVADRSLPAGGTSVSPLYLRAPDATLPGEAHSSGTKAGTKA